MSDTEENASSLGKRPRSDNEPAENVSLAQNDAEESDDEDVGPMPMTGVEVQKKRRKGACSRCLHRDWASNNVENGQFYPTSGFSSNIYPVRTNTTRVSCTEMSSTSA